MDTLTIFLAKDLFVIAPLLTAYVWLRQTKDKKVSLILTSIIAFILAYVIVKLASKLYYDPRPFVKSGVAPLIAHTADNGFPSDHSWFTATIAGLVYLYDKNIGYFLGLVALVVGISRVHAGVHSSIDILGGFIIAAVAVGAAKYLAPKFRH